MLLTQQEIDAAREFWAAGGTDDAWQALLARCGPAYTDRNRAQWLVRQTAPGADPGPAREPSNPLRLTAGGLPARWLAVAFADGRKVAHAWSEPVRQPLVLGPDVASGAIGPSQILTDPETAWLTNYEAAVQAGMAIELPLDTARTSLDMLLVVGVRDPAPVGVPPRT